MSDFSIIEPQISGLTLIIAEDEPLIAMDITARVSAWSAEVIGTVASVHAGLSLLERVRPNVALLDFNLKDGPVTPLALRLRELGVPFALFTAKDAYSLPLVLASAANVGKPPTDARLRAVLSSMMC